MAVVIAHEVAHALARHGAERMSDQMVASVGTTAAAVALSATVSGRSRTYLPAMMAAVGAGATVGYILPMSRGGRDTWMNVVTACRTCNQKKGSRTPEEAHMHLLYAPYVPNRAEYLILTNRRILTKLALLWGMVPSTLPSALEALDRVRHGEPFDVAVLDMSMPDCDGLDLAARLAAAGVNAGVCVDTAHSGAASTSAATHSGTGTVCIRSTAPTHVVVDVMGYYHGATSTSRAGYGGYSGIVPKEVSDAGAGNWKNANGTGPFQLTDYVQGNAVTFSKNPVYWDKEKIGGTDHKLPFVDKIVYRTIKDEASFLTALRTGKLDDNEFSKFATALERLQEVKLHIDETPLQHIQRLRPSEGQPRLRARIAAGANCFVAGSCTREADRQGFAVALQDPAAEDLRVRSGGVQSLEKRQRFRRIFEVSQRLGLQPQMEIQARLRCLRLKPLRQFD